MYNCFVIPDNTIFTMARKSIACVVAIDFGTTYSGYAFSTVEQYKKNKLDINLNPAWNSGAHQLLSCKTPTTLLLTKSGEFVSYGYTAERQYENILLDKNKDENDYLYFRRFKMELHSRKVKHCLIHSKLKVNIYIDNIRELSEDIKFICTTMYIYCVYPAMSKNPKQLLNCLKIRTTSVIRIIYIYIIGIVAQSSRLL